jgi:uncharacterized protein YifE (UPF0438 family)
MASDMTNNQLTDWDRRLLKRYLSFYQDLDTGRREPSTPSQRQFVRVCRGEGRPRTQHEVAYHRFKKVESHSRSPNSTSRTAVGEAKRGAAEPLGFATRSETKPLHPDPVEIIDLIEAAEFSERGRSNHKHLFENLKNLYQTGRDKAKSLSADAAIWASTCLGDRSLEHDLTAWLTDQYGHLSNIYTKAMDGSFAIRGLQPGPEYVSPDLHRLFEGHSIHDAWQRVCDALPDDTLLQEMRSYVSAMWSDMVTPTGLPLFTLTPDGYEHLKEFGCQGLGIPVEWLNHILHYNAVDVVQGIIPIVPVILAWSSEEAERYARLIGSLGIGTFVAANPLAAIVAVVILARGMHMCRGKAGYSEWALGVLKGGATSGAILATGTLIGGPAWVGLVAGTAAGLWVSRKTRQVKVADIRSFLTARISEATNLMRSKMKSGGIGLSAIPAPYAQ